MSGAWLMENAVGLLSLLLVVIAGLWGVIKYVQTQIDAHDRKNKSDIDALHTRINDVRAEYVHHDHMEDMIGALGKNMEAVAQEQRRTNNRIDDILKMFAEDGRRGKTSG